MIGRLNHLKKLTILLFCLIFVLTSCGNDESNPAPSFELEDLNGNIVKLEELAGKKVYIKFWTSWCSICLAGLKELNELAAEENDFTVISIVHPSYKGEQKRDSFISWYESLDYQHIPVLLDENGEWTERFRVMAYPTSYYISTDQTISKSAVGHQTNEDIKRTMEKIK